MRMNINDYVMIILSNVVSGNKQDWQCLTCKFRTVAVKMRKIFPRFWEV